MHSIPAPAAGRPTSRHTEIERVEAEHTFQRPWELPEWQRLCPAIPAPPLPHPSAPPHPSALPPDCSGLRCHSNQHYQCA
ncbi:hypothetical protein SKAU_G00011620 [Synaphobranchus kaupii]|uniref:Uncharacterized protein n=1 Tax=Synaphobranchus kaupii TaxID=118154 RepID=A0A9Q1JDK4_SYNKA|nr:hypothetical protein SKAU_G00011620 [Synaphobranchus kaupii]